VVLFPYTANSKELPDDSVFEAVKKHDVGVFGIRNRRPNPAEVPQLKCPNRI
jgi:hypothetical protein